MKMKAFNQLSQSAVYKEDDVSVSITVCGGSYGGGSETLIIGEGDGEKLGWHTDIPHPDQE